MLSSGCSEIGTGSSNSLPSSNRSGANRAGQIYRALDGENFARSRAGIGPRPSLAKKHFLTTTTPSMLKLYSSVVEGREAAAADKVGDRSHRAAPVAISSASILVAGEM